MMIQQSDTDRFEQPAFAYLRVSGRGQVKGDGLPRQSERIIEYARTKGFSIVGEFIDGGVSGTRGIQKRRAFTEMLLEAVSQGVKIIIVESLDRFARDLSVQLALLASLEAHGIALISATTGEDVTASIRDDPMKEALVMVQGTFAQLDKKLLTRKLAKGRAAKRKATGRCEGRKPFGHYAGEQETLARLKLLHRKPKGSKRRSCAAIARILDDEGWAARNGKPWSRSSVYAILQHK